ncbi:DUF2812 domain-containing protein [Staphylococcus simulans]|uniref:DUF2812 domain-containing protein n=1 Tax=Staphylococcus simulans TaxID=1286 RepID=UPI000D0434AC|nr:DUF2812 domain-containing protein [Staphylococcus simulans]
MKKLKLTLKGSLAEQKFLEQKKQEGYYLTRVINGVYTFKHNPAVKNMKLQVNFIKTKDIETQPALDNNSPYFAMTTKQLNYSKHTLVYSYLKDTENPIYSNTDTKAEEYQYLKHFQNTILTLAILALFICIALWAYFTSIGYTNVMAPLPMKIMSGVFIAIVLFYLMIKHRIRTSCPTYVDQFYLSYSVSIRTTDGPPDLNKLKHLGAWRYVLEKNGKYYYNLHSKQPKDSIIHSICTRLDMKPEQIFVYSALDLFPIRGHF